MIIENKQALQMTKSLEAICNTYGVELPSRLAEEKQQVEDLQQKYRAMHVEADEAVKAMYAAEDLDAALEQAINLHQRASAAKAALGATNLNNLRDVRLGHALRDGGMNATLATLATPVAKDVATLTKHAGDLPSNPLDAQSVVRSVQAGKAFMPVVNILERLTVLVAGLPGSYTDTPVLIKQLGWIVHLDDTSVDVNKRGRYLNSNAQHQEQNAQVRRMRDDYSAKVKADPTAPVLEESIVRIARGEYAGLMLSFADTDAEYERRVEALTNGILYEDTNRVPVSF